MLEARPARVVGRVPEPEVRPEVDDRDAAVDKAGHDLGGRAMGQCEEDRIDFARQVGGDPRAGPREVRMAHRQRLVVPIARLQSDDAHRGMARQDPYELAAAVTGRADDPDLQLAAVDRIVIHGG